MGPFFDPDRRLFSQDKLFHLGAAFGLTFVLGLVYATPWWGAGLVVIILAVAFELGQWDAARGTEYAGQVGYGFGLLDMLAVVVGAALATALQVGLASI